MTGPQQRLLLVGDEGVADDVAATVDDATVEAADHGAAVHGDLDAGDYDGVLVADGGADATDAVREVAADDEAPDVLLVTTDGGGIDDALDAGAVDYVRTDDPPRVVRRRIRDLTGARSDRERELDRYRTLVETAGDAMYALDADGTITMVNESHVEFADRSRDSLVGSHPGERLGDEAVAEARSVIREILRDDDRTRGRVEFELEDADGTVRRFEDNLAVLTDEAGNYAGSVGVIRDITERKERERELDRYRTLVEAVGDPMYVLDEGGIVTMANEAMATHLGYDREEIVGTHTVEFVADEDYERGTELLRELYEDDERDWATYEMDSVTADGERTPAENNVAVLTDESGDYAGSAGVVRDIAERKRRTEALRRQNERLDEFASVVGHDLRNPLNVVLGHLELARETGETRHFDVIEEEIGRVEDLLDELLALARQGKVVDEPEAVSLVAVARAAWDGVATGDATLELPENDLTVEADETRLRELFGNLFRNAVEHAGPGATVRVGTTAKGFYVEDDGPGIPESDRDRVFDRGYTTADDGTGLGLDIVERIAEGHGWTVTATASGGADRDARGRLLRGSGGGQGGSGGARFEFRTAFNRR
ncbi:PAS domain S-box protein [Halostella sp. JP-L12]|uniref:sensor histidine kinase n=1 Tax=Halostella TaxID=1843185 RepID=UPI000EF80A91|nr:MULTISPECIES: PAS domain-containing sensor histidine kinase [Halostella]NHN47737.1 PAS domain S-box protein [Halostella sp. JP-L12]